MGHPDRRMLRERKRKTRQKEKMLGRRSFVHVLDLTPYNAVGCINSPGYSIKYK